MKDLLSRDQLDAYFQRAVLTCAPTTDAAGLAVLHRAQFFTIPFENFDVLVAGGPIDRGPLSTQWNRKGAKTQRTSRRTSHY